MNKSKTEIKITITDDGDKLKIKIKGNLQHRGDMIKTVMNYATRAIIDMAPEDEWELEYSTGCECTKQLSKRRNNG